jgi:hypothetical protein
MNTTDEYWRQSQQRGQLAMTGDDWTSDRDKRAQARADAAVRKASVAAAVKMRAAAEALRAQLMASFEAGHADKMGEGDGRRRLARDLDELAGWFESVYGGGA